MMKIPNRKSQKYHYSPLRYPGGKSFLYPWFDNLIDKNGLSELTFVEPYAGGAGSALALLLLEKVDRIVINDLDRAIYSFWRSALVETERFLEVLHKTPVTVKEWLRQRAVYRETRPRRFDLGFASFYLNRTNVSGILGGGPIGGVDQNGKWKITARFNKDTLSKRIAQIADYRNRIIVSQQDGLELISCYLRTKNTLIYSDPPYYEKGASLYLNHYDRSDHVLLAYQLNHSAKANWVLTYDNSRVIRELYAERQRYNFSLTHSAHISKRGKEVLILSDALAA